MILEVREKYSGLSYDELVQIAQDSNMSDLDFILAQPELSEEFKTWLSDRGTLDDFEEAEATLFFEGLEMFLTTYQEDF